MKKLLIDILCIPSESGNCDAMFDFISGHCQGKGMSAEQDERGNLYITKGKAKTYPCVVAHMDTVHHIEKGGIVPVAINGNVTGINPLTMEQTGIGGDDKCGIYAAIMCLEKLPACKAAFFVDEEVGCLGSGDCCIEWFSDCRFILQADRRGNGDWVEDISGPLGSKEFQKAVSGYLKKYGYKPCKGMMSDVMALRDSKVGVSAANMSAGYYNPHQACEYISIHDLNNVTAMMIAICGGLTDSYPFTYERPAAVYRSSGYKSHTSFGSAAVSADSELAQWVREEWPDGDHPALKSYKGPNPDGGHPLPEYYSQDTDCQCCGMTHAGDDLFDTPNGSRICGDCAWAMDTSEIGK